MPSSAERRAGEDRANNGTTPRQQKVLFVNICHRHWLFSARGFPREFPSVLLPLCCYALRGPRNARGVLGCALRFRPREFPRLIPLHSTPSTIKITPKVIFICISAKNVVSLHPKVQRRGLEGGRCPLSESQTICQIPSRGFQDIFKRRLLTLRSDVQKSRKFQ